MKGKNMKYLKVKTAGKNDCCECCFAMTCTDECRLKRGYHYEKVYHFEEAKEEDYL